ncbi:MAG: glutathione S-transferase family protein [Deltaproteobacteria bacterium]|nr:MAG: glutathione S-transferase family protein [Deltaproteobacteria bacterium]
MATLYGVGGSPFVRKVRVVCAEKNIPYDHEPVFPGQVDRKISPLGKVPGWKDERGPLSDSSIICAYLEGVKPEPALYPRDPYERARALWFEEYGDSALLGVFGPKIFFKKIIGPRFMGQQFDPAEIQKAWDEEAPPLLEYLESQLAGDWLVGKSFSIGDIGVATQFANLHQAGYRTDAKRWPKLAAYVERVHARPSFTTLIAEDDAFLALTEQR